MPSYKIIIQEIDIVEVKKNLSHKKWDYEAWSDIRKSVSDTDDLPSQYDNIEVTEQEVKERVIYSQTIEEKPDMLKVINAFNSAA